MITRLAILVHIVFLFVAVSHMDRNVARIADKLEQLK